MPPKPVPAPAPAPPKPQPAPHPVPTPRPQPPQPVPAPTPRPDPRPDPSVEPPPVPSNATHVGAIYFDKGLSNKERVAFITALNFLATLHIPLPDPQLLAFMRIAKFDGATVRRWLEDRIQYIVPEDAEQDKLKALNANYRGYANPDQIPPAILDGLNETRGHVVMSNIGAVIYLLGKAKNILFGITSDYLGTIAVTSPRSGVLQVGEGLFLLPSELPNVVKIFHLSTLIHESRHGDGNRLTTGFLHEKCVKGEFAGQVACDHNYNGPYEIESMVTKMLAQNCAKCSAKEMQVLSLLYLDTTSRLIQDAGTKIWDDAPEGHR